MANQDNNRSRNQDMGTRKEPEQQEQARDKSSGKQAKKNKPDQGAQFGEPTRPPMQDQGRH